MIADPVPPTALIDAAKRFAALSGVFDPAQALPAAAMADPTIATVVASALASACDTTPDAGKGWLLRSAERRYILDTLAHDATLPAAIAVRRETAVDEASGDLLAALSGDGDYAPGAIDRLLADDGVPRARIERIATALDRAGSAAPAFAALQAARNRLAEIDGLARRDQIAARGFFGRKIEQAALDTWLDQPLTAPPTRTALLTGMPGIGKSALLEQTVQVAVDGTGSLIVRLDFDRAGLDVLDLRGLTMEVARQLADRIGGDDATLRDARLTAAGTARGGEKFDGSQRAQMPDALAQAIGASVQAAKRPVLVVLDTLEVLRARGDRHPALLFDWLDRLVMAGMQPVRIIAAGRGDILDPCPDRCGLALPLTGLEDEAAAQLLDRMGVAPAARPPIIAIADGNPLVLRLAANVANGYGVAKLPTRRMEGDVAAGFLYRFLLSRINDPLLRQLAHPGLIARRISAAFLREVLAPQLRLPAIDAARATMLFEALASEHWLVERDPVDPDFVRHRGDMRAVLLGLLYRDRPAICARIDRAAVRWFGRRPGDASQLDAAYHSLQLMRAQPAPPLIPAAIAQRMDDATIAELPPAARDVVTAAAGGRTSAYRGTGSPVAGDAEAVQVLTTLIERGDWAEGRYVVGQIEQGGIDARSATADAVRAYHWRAGRWQAARRLLAERDRIAADDGDLAALPPVIAVARLEMRAEFTPRLIGAALALPATTALLAQGTTLPGVLIQQGGLALMLAARKLRPAADASRRDGDVVAAAFDLWSQGAGRGGVTNFAFGVARDRLVARGLKSADAGWDNPQLLAAPTPYAVFAANLATQADGDGLGAAAAKADTRIAAAGALFSTKQLAPSPANPIGGIASLGLFAEWAEVQAMLSRNPDLREIGRAAARWRRTIAGDWRYGRPPPEWRGTGPLDRGLTRRITQLAKAKDPAAAARAQLAMWAPDGDGDALLTLLRRRLAVALRRAAEVPDPIPRAVRLIGAGVPAAFVPPLAVLPLPPSDRSL